MQEVGYHFADTLLLAFQQIRAHPELHGFWFIRELNRWHRSIRLRDNGLAIIQCPHNPTLDLELQQNTRNNLAISTNKYNHTRL